MKIWNQLSIEQFSSDKPIDFSRSIFVETIKRIVYERQRYKKNVSRFFRFRSCETNYFDAEIEAAVIDNKLFFPRADQMNDPFDTQPIFNENISFSEYSNFVFPILWSQSLLTTIRMNEMGLISNSRYVEFMKNLNSTNEIIITKSYQHRKNNKKEFHNLFFKAPHILSLTTDHKNQMLWSMYASVHNGICFELAGLQNPTGFKHNNSLGHKMRPVEVIYSSDRPKMDYIGTAISLASPDLNCLYYLHQQCRQVVFDNIHQLDYIRTKNHRWEHENEYRMIIHDVENTNYYELENVRVSKIFIGMNVNSEKIKFIRDICNRSNIRIELYQGMKTDTGDGLCFNRV